MGELQNSAGFVLIYGFKPLQFAKVARLTGLEPATSGVTGRHSNQLSYNRAVLRYAQRSGVVRAGPPQVKMRIRQYDVFWRDFGNYFASR